MRDPDRLDIFYKKLCELHKTLVPDWRFGQLISNFSYWRDPFYLEEEECLIKIENWLKESLKITNNKGE